MWIEAETKIKGGLRVIVRGDYCKGHPRVYPGCDEIEDMEILWPSGHEVKFEICPADWEKAAECLFEKARRR